MTSSALSESWILNRATGIHQNHKYLETPLGTQMLNKVQGRSTNHPIRKRNIPWQFHKGWGKTLIQIRKQNCINTKQHLRANDQSQAPKKWKWPTTPRLPQVEAHNYLCHINSQRYTGEDTRREIKLNTSEKEPVRKKTRLVNTEPRIDSMKTSWKPVIRITLINGYIQKSSLDQNLVYHTTSMRNYYSWA